MLSREKEEKFDQIEVIHSTSSKFNPNVLCFSVAVDIHVSIGILVKKRMDVFLTRIGTLQIRERDSKIRNRVLFNHDISLRAQKRRLILQLIGKTSEMLKHGQTPIHEPR
jgi:hypothetical protein